MNCDGARDSMVLAAYGELPDEELIGLEQHLSHCAECGLEMNELRGLDGWLALHPVKEPDANLLAQSRMRLDEALDAMPRVSLLDRVWANGSAWLGHLRGAPALATLLVGVGFLGGNFTYRYQVGHAPAAKAPAIMVSSPNGGGVASISEIAELPGDRVQVRYNRVVPEMAQGSLDDPQIRSLLTVGTRAAATNGVRATSVALLANECAVGHECAEQSDGSGVRGVLMTSLRTDRSPMVRMHALDGLRRYVSEDEQVRDAVSHALLEDPNAEVRARAIALLTPVQGDTSVRQVLRQVSTTDDNPYIRTVSYKALQSVASIQ